MITLLRSNVDPTVGYGSDQTTWILMGRCWQLCRRLAFVAFVSGGLVTYVAVLAAGHEGVARVVGGSGIELWRPINCVDRQEWFTTPCGVEFYGEASRCRALRRLANLDAARGDAGEQ